MRECPNAQRYTRRGVRNMLPPGSAPKDDRVTRQAQNLLNHLQQSMLFNKLCGMLECPNAQRYTRRGVRNMLPPGSAPKDDRATNQTGSKSAQSFTAEYVI